MGSLITRADFGGPSVPMEYRQELASLNTRSRDVALAYTYDMTMYLGGDFLVITEKTGLYAPRIRVPSSTAQAIVKFNNDDLLSAADPARFLNLTLREAMLMLAARISRKDAAFDHGEERRRIDLLFPCLPARL